MTRTSAESRINDLIERIEAITLETQEITRELRHLQRSQLLTPAASPAQDSTERIEDPRTPIAIAVLQASTPPAPAAAQSIAALHDFKIGDRVTITNSYLGKRGITGTVTAVTLSQVTIQDKNGRFHKRKYTNLRHE